MGRAMEHLFNSAQFDVTVESLSNDIAYYKAMLAETSRNSRSTRTIMSPEMLRERLLECERLLAQLQRRH